MQALLWQDTEVMKSAYHKCLFRAEKTLDSIRMGKGMPRELIWPERLPLHLSDVQIFDQGNAFPQCFIPAIFKPLSRSLQ